MSVLTAKTRHRFPPVAEGLPRVAQRGGQRVHGDLDGLGNEEGLVAGSVAAQQLELDGVER